MGASLRRRCALRDEVLYDLSYLEYHDADGTASYLRWVSGAIRVGDWKLLLREPYCNRTLPRATTDACEERPLLDWLFNLTADPSESVNLIAEHPERRLALLERLQWHFNHTLGSARWLPYDENGSWPEFAANDRFVTHWTDWVQNESRILYPKPAWGSVQWSHPEHALANESHANRQYDKPTSAPTGLPTNSSR